MIRAIEMDGGNIFKILWIYLTHWNCCCSITKSCPTLCNPMDCSMQGFPVLHHLPELYQTHVHWGRDAISSFVVPFSSCPQSFPASGSFLMSQLFVSGGQSIGASAPAPVLPMSSQHWFPLGLTGLISFQGILKSIFQHHSLKLSILWSSAFFMVQLSHPYMTTGKTMALTQFSSVQWLSCVRLFVTPWTAACQASLSITNS